MSKESYPIVVIFRLAEYHCLLSELIKSSDSGLVTSKEIANYLGYSEEVVRKDLSYIPEDTGTPGVGYDIRKLHKAISKILHLDYPHRTVLFGSITTWQGIFNFFDPRKYGFMPEIILSEYPDDEGKIFESIPARYIKNIKKEALKDTKIAIIATTPSWVKAAAQAAFEAGIRGVLNLTPTVLDEVPEDVYVSQVLLPCEIKLVTYHIMENIFSSPGSKLKKDIGKRAARKRSK